MQVTRDGKPRPNRARYVQTLRAMTEEQRLAKALELSELVRALTLAGLRERHPEASDDEIHAKYIERLERCRKRTS